LDRAFPRLDTLPFESQHQYMATLHAAEDKSVIYMKGSVERVLACCSDHYGAAGVCGPLDAAHVHRAVDALATHGLRVLAFARRDAAAEQVSVTHADVSSGLSFLGLQAMMDPPRQ